MFRRFIDSIAIAFEKIGIESFKTERQIVEFVVDSLSEYVEAERTVSVASKLAQPDSDIATQSEVQDLGTIVTALESEQTAQEKLLRDLASHLVHALNYISDLKTISHVEPDLPRGHRDMVWRAADCAQTQLETALGHISQDELTGWLEITN